MSFLLIFYPSSSLSLLLSLHIHPLARSLSCALYVLFHTTSQPIFSPQALSCIPLCSFVLVLVRSTRGFCPFKHVACSSFHSSVVCLWQQWANHVHRSNVYHCKSIFSSPFYVYTAKKFPGMEGLPPFNYLSLAMLLMRCLLYKNLRRFLVLWLTKVSRYESARTFDRENLVPPRIFLCRTANPWDPESPSRTRRVIVKVKRDTMITVIPPTITTRSPISLANPRTTPASDLSVK